MLYATAYFALRCLFVIKGGHSHTMLVCLKSKRGSRGPPPKICTRAPKKLATPLIPNINNCITWKSLEFDIFFIPHPNEEILLWKRLRPLSVAIIKLPSCLTLLTLETYNLCFIASKLLTVADMMAI